MKPKASPRVLRAPLRNTVLNTKFGRRVVPATQSFPDIQRHEKYRRKTSAFEEWRLKLRRGDRLPRGKFFKGKSPGRKLFVMDEFWQALS